MRSLLLTITLFQFTLGHGQPMNGIEHPKQDLIDFLFEYLEVMYLNVPLQSGHLLYVSIYRQSMFHIMDGALVEEFSVSTAKKGLGSKTDSYRTPTGLMRISDKIGRDTPYMGILESREYSGEVAEVNDPDRVSADCITSRILWLEGMEPGQNRGGDMDTHDRYIYIHGTTDERSIGTPASLGCVRMRNIDIIRLFDEVPVGTHVVILDN